MIEEISKVVSYIQEVRKIGAIVSPVQYAFIGYTVDLSNINAISDAKFYDRKVFFSIIFKSEMSNMVEKQFEWYVQTTYMPIKEADRISREHTLDYWVTFNDKEAHYIEVEKSLEILQGKINELIDIWRTYKDQEKVQDWNHLQNL